MGAGLTCRVRALSPWADWLVGICTWNTLEERACTPPRCPQAANTMMRAATASERTARKRAGAIRIRDEESTRLGSHAVSETPSVLQGEEGPASRSLLSCHSPATS